MTRKIREQEKTFKTTVFLRNHTEEGLLRTEKETNQSQVIGSGTNENRANTSKACSTASTEPNQAERIFSLSQLVFGSGRKKNLSA